MENYTTYKPEWAPSDAGKEFACQVMSGIDEVGHPSEPGPARFVRKQYTVDDYVEGVLRGDRMMLAKAITLIERSQALRSGPGDSPAPSSPHGEFRPGGHYRRTWRGEEHLH